MEREVIDNIEYIVGYHTQEYREGSSSLMAPLECRHQKAWLGKGYYFWTEIEFAHYWGKDSKKATGFYDIYVAQLNCENCINAVFDEEGYMFFCDCIEEAIMYMKENAVPMALDQMNRFLAENIWTKIDIGGIIFDDKPINPKGSPGKYSEIPRFYYKKRIQIVIFDRKNIERFRLLLHKQPTSN